MIRIASLLSLIVISHAIYAWGRTGHMIVGHIADQYTSEKTKKAIHEILGNESLSEAGTWMDDVMNDKAYSNMDNWHYVKKDEHLEDNGLIMIGKLSDILKDPNSSAKDRLIALRGLTHIVGDLHQPLHCGYIKDAGGNDMKMKWKHPSSKTNLHKVWDTDMIKMKMKPEDQYSKELVDAIEDAKVNEWTKAEPKVWVEESQSYLDQVYKFKHHHIDHEYYNANIETIDLRLSQAGVRLAYLLNSIFDQAS
jgi:hypothetical protein